MAMRLLSRSCPILLGAVGLSWREARVIGVSIMPESLNYCSKNMTSMQLPSLADSVRASFKGVSEDDVELIQVRFSVAKRFEIS